MVIYTEDKAEKFLGKYVPVAKSVLTKTSIDAIAASRKLKFPLVLKLISPKALHKTEVNGIRFVNNLDELRKEYRELHETARKKKLRLTGILAQQHVNGEEVIIGLNKDPTFGPVIAFGIGGKYVEIIKDVAFRACPITKRDAQNMIDELKYKQILYGARGRKKVNLALLKQVLVDVSKLSGKHEIQELDINPFIINERIGKVVDARIRMK